MDGSPLGFGLMQQGGSFGGPLAMQRARDPRFAYAQALARGATDTSPVQSPWQGVARLGQAALSGYLSNKASGDWDNRESNRAMAIANALKDASGTPAETKAYGDGTTINWDERKPNFQAAISGLAANPDTADMAMRMGMDERQYQRGRADKAADVSGERGFMLQRDQIQNEYGTARDDLSRAHAMFMQDRSAANQAALQGAQQRFTAAENAAQRLFQGQQQTNAQNFALSSAAPIARGQTEGQLGAQLAPAPDQYQTPGAVPKSNAQVLKEGQQAAENAGKGFDRSNTLRDEYNKLTTDFRTIQDAYTKIKNTSDNGAGDMSLLYSYVKLLDPGSVVRESEFATAAASGSFGQQVQGAVQRVLTGERLPSDLRASFKNEAENLYKSQKAGADRVKGQYTDIAKRYGLKPEDVITDYAEASPPKLGGDAAGKAAYDALPSGAQFVDPTGQIRTKP